MRSAAVLAFSLVLPACTSPVATKSTLTEEAPMSKAAWIEKLSRVLRAGKPIGPDDDMDTWLELAPEDIVDVMMNDPSFGDALIDFNLFFLGRSTDQLRDDVGSYSQDVSAVPAAMVAARELLSGGSLSTIFFSSQPVILSAVNNPRFLTPAELENEMNIFVDDDVNVEDPLGVFNGDLDPIIVPEDQQAAMTPRRRQAILFAQAEDAKRVANRIAGAYRDFSPDETDFDFCETKPFMEAATISRLLMSGFGPGIANAMTADILAPAFSTTTGTCKNGEDLEPFLADIREVGTSLAAKISMLSEFGPFRAESITSTRLLDSRQSAWTADGFWKRLPNSSTNFNRKRAAYVLRTFFCDDLTPIEIPAMEEHGLEAHASDPACKSCHYKLDPMAGLFRHFGTTGHDFQEQETFVFDDEKEIAGEELDAYLGSWQRDGVWNVGFFTGEDQPHPDWRGDSFEDLWRFVASADEVKQCLSQRFAEYFLGTDQVYDGAWLRQVTSPLQQDLSANSVKSVIKDLVLSKTFHTQDPVRGRCYDFVDNQEEGGDRAPCAVAHVLQRHCVSCHGNAGGLDLSRWTDLGNGQTGFPHIVDGEQIDGEQSLRTIKRRIESTDTMLRMPRGGNMSDRERQILFRWLSERLGE